MSDCTLPPGGPDTDLLFAALALQVHFVSRDDLVEVLELWANNRQRSVARIMVEQHLLSPHRRRVLDDLLTEYLIQYDMDAARGLAAACSGRGEPFDFSRFATAVTASSLPTLTWSQRNESLGARIEGPPSNVGATTSAGKRFRTLRLHAEGALGRVFLAHDEELNRQVALKEIQAEYTRNADCRARFLFEAEITASLEHPGVVPVYGLGLHSDGRPYYAMRFIHGESLHDALTRFHLAEHPARDPGERALALRGLLGRFVAVCNAIAFAHARGIVHRDIKPSNIMLGSYGETLVVDWGLAKAIGRVSPACDPGTGPSQTGTATSKLATGAVPTSEGDRPTLSEPMATVEGQAVGTPSFMSPEAAAGHLERIGVASDIYSLGSTLYNVLTGVPPYTGRDATHILTRVERNDFPPPRQAKAAVPPALEAVILKAMALAPQDRYPSASELEQDVQRWLADEPVGAYREPLLPRVLRWGRRHRQLVTGLAGLLVSAVIGLTAGLWAVNNQKELTARQRDTAEYNFRLARQAVDECFLLATEDPLLQQSRMRGVRRLLLQKALPFYEGFKTQNPDNDDIRFEVGKNHFRVAHITSEIGNKTDAIESYEQARTIFSALVERNPNEASLRADLARVHNNLGLVLRATGRLDRALGELKEALSIRDHLVGERPTVAEYQNDLAATDNNIGALQCELNAPEEAKRHFGYARDTLTRLVRDHPHELRYRVSLAATQHNLGRLLAENGLPDRAVETYNEARQIREKLARDNPAIAEYRSDLAQTLIHIASLLTVRQPDKAQELFKQARELCDLLVKESPEDAVYRFDLATACNGLGILVRNQTTLSVELHSRALSLLEVLVKEHPGEHDYQIALAGTYLNLGRAHQAGPRPQDALVWFDRVPPCIASIPKQERSGAEARLVLRNAVWSKADTLGKIGRHRLALASWDEAVRLSDSVDLDILQGRAAALARTGNYTRAVEEAEAILRRKGVTREIRYEVACVFALAAHRAAGDTSRPNKWRQTESDRLAGRAVELLDKARQGGLFRSAELREHLKADGDLEVLRVREDYRQLLQRLEATDRP